MFTSKQRKKAELFLKKIGLIRISFVDYEDLGQFIFATDATTFTTLAFKLPARKQEIIEKIANSRRKMMGQ